MPSWSGTPHSLGVSHIILRERDRGEQLAVRTKAFVLSVGRY
jgi:hypothetical protein